MITPVGSEKSEGRSEKEGEPSTSSFSSFNLQTSHFQLTHDYLVPSLRDWLTRKQRETRRGRAELRLEERADTWGVKPENRYLPSLWEYARIATLTRQRDWHESQRQMMRAAGRFYATRTALLTVGVLVLGYVVFEAMTRQHVRGLVDKLAIAAPSELPKIVNDLDAHPKLASAYLSPLLSQPADTPAAKSAQLHARLATVGRDPSLVEPLLEELLSGNITYVQLIRQRLRPSATTLTEQLRSILCDEKADAQRRFRAAIALADFVPPSDSASWKDQDLKFVAEQLASSNADLQPLLSELLWPIRERLLQDLERIFRDPRATDSQRLGAAKILVTYAASDVARLTRLLALATPEQHAVLYRMVAVNRTVATIGELSQIAATPPPKDMSSSDRIAFGKRRANAAVTLFLLGEMEKATPIFEWSDDPEALTQFIFRCRPGGVSADALLDCLQMVSNASRDRYPKDTRYALLMALGEFSLAEIPEPRRDALLAQLADWFAHDPSSGVHGASGWLLRHWGQTEVANRIDRTPVSYSPDREWFTLPVDVAGVKETYYYTFVVFRPGEYMIGSVNDEPERPKQQANREKRHLVKITRPFALLDREITNEELLILALQSRGVMQEFNTQKSQAAIHANWYDAVRFCRSLGFQRGLTESDQPYALPRTRASGVMNSRIQRAGATIASENLNFDFTRMGFRLPTEAEWEIAARGGARTSYGFGSDVGLLENFAWYSENSGKSVHPPRRLRPTIRGLFDMNGNVYEWTHDWFDNFGAETATDPTGPKVGDHRVFRGGSWSAYASFARVAHRSANSPISSLDFVGFRLAMSLSSSAVPGQKPGVRSTIGPQK